MIGRRLQNYKIEKLIDEGGMGSVYEGVHMHLGRRVAIKALNPLLSEKSDIKQRFKNEAITLSKLKHPNIVALYDYIEDNEGTFLILEYLKGQTLDKYINNISGPIPEKRAIKYFLQMLDAIGYMHSKNIIHRDIKPANFILTPSDNIKILDFGIAKILGETNNKITKHGTKVGTALYMSPQQVKGQVLDRRTDVYSLGVTFFQILTGQYPYEENLSEYDIYNKIIQEPLPPLKDFYIGISSEMEEIIYKATAKRPLDRYQSCDEFANDIYDKIENSSTEDNLKRKNTQIIDFSPIETVKKNLDQGFWRNLLLLFVVSIFFGAIAISIYTMQRLDMQHIVSNEASLYNGDSTNAEKLEVLDYGEVVKIPPESKVIENNDIKWQEVFSLRGNKGYIQKQYLANTKLFNQINKIFKNNYAQKQTPIEYKWLIWKYFIESQFFSEITTNWFLIAEPQNDIELNSIALGDFNNNKIMDFACILTNNVNNNSKLLIFFDKKNENILVDFKQKVKIRTIDKGRSGGGWFIGNIYERTNKKGKAYTVNKYEYLSHDGLLLFKPDSEETYVYLYKIGEKRLIYYLQPQ